MAALVVPVVVAICDCCCFLYPTFCFLLNGGRTFFPIGAWFGLFLLLSLKKVCEGDGELLVT